MKRISPATVTFGVMAIVLGLVAAFVVRQSLRKPQPVVAQAPAPELVGVVIASRNIPINTQIQLTDLTVVNVRPDHEAVKNSVKHPASAAGRIAKETIRAGSVVKDAYLLGIGEHLPDLAERIPAGHRAVTVSVVGSSTGGKRLTEGDYVDIALTVEGDHPDLGDIQTRTLMRNVMVVDAAAGVPLRASSSRNQMIAQQTSGDALTVAVSEADANRLIVAERTGTLSVTLCSRKDQEDLADDTTISRRELLALREIPPPPTPEPPAPVIPPPPPKVFKIERYVGGSREIIEMTEERINEAKENAKYVTPGNITEPVSKEEQDDQDRSAIRNLSPFTQAGLPN